MTIVFDTSAVIALLKQEPGADVAARLARGALLSAVNLIEVRSKLIDAVTDLEAAMRVFDRYEIVVAPFTPAQAMIAADLWPRVRGRDIALAYRACLALAIDRQATVVTGDRQWVTLDLALDIRLIR